MASEKGAVVKIEDYPVVSSKPQETMQVIKDNSGAHGFSAFDLDRVKIPAGGGQAFEIPGLGEEPDVAKSFDAIIIHFRDARRYFAKSFDETGGGAPPDCFSDDGFMGVGTPGGACEKCPNATFGTDPKGGRGQACKQIRMLFCMRPGGVIPVVLSLPPTSLSGCRKYFLRLGSQRTPFWAVVTRIGLAKQKGGTGIEYSAATFSMAAKLTTEQAEGVRKVRESLLPALDGVRPEHDEEANPARSGT
jgi:hypothetical protein